MKADSDVTVIKNIHIALYDKETGTWGEPIKVEGMEEGVIINE